VNTIGEAEVFLLLLPALAACGAIALSAWSIWRRSTGFQVLCGVLVIVPDAVSLLVLQCSCTYVPHVLIAATIPIALIQFWWALELKR
jgi:hypothetical protein